MRDFHNEYERSHDALYTPRVSTLTLPPDAQSASLHVSKHDHHSIEIKSVVELLRGRNFELQTEAYLFFPGSVRLSTWSKVDIAGDFHSQVRMSVPFLADSGKVALEHAESEFTESCRRYAAEATPKHLNTPIFDDSNIKSQNLIEAGRRYAAVFSELLKHHATNQRKKLKQALKELDAMTGAARVCALRSSVYDVQRTVNNTRSMFRYCHTITEGDAAGARALLELLQEYVGHLYVNYLGDVSKAILRANKEVSAAHECICRELTALALDITILNKTEACNEGAFKNSGDDQAVEHSTVRLGSLKKFFQSSLFFDVVPRASMQRISETAAVVGALLAASGAYFIETIHNPAFKTYASQGAFVVFFGIFLYVLKDRLKDRLKNKFLETMSSVIPDSELHLYIKKKRIGVSKSWLKTMKRGTVPASIRLARSAAARSSLEQAVPEDVLHYKRKLAINGGATAREGHAGPVMSLRDGLRINLERHLRFLDDPYKNLYALNTDGTVSERKAHKVYHFYLCVQTTCSASSSSTLTSIQNKSMTLLVKNSTYRIVMDKQGIERVERIDSASIVRK